jgi:hypothetical protein
MCVGSLLRCINSWRWDHCISWECHGTNYTITQWHSCLATKTPSAISSKSSSPCSSFSPQVSFLTWWFYLDLGLYVEHFHFHVQNLLRKFVSYILKLCPYQVILLCIIHYGACGSTFGWGTALQVGRWRVRVPMVSLGFFIDIILPTPLGLTQPLTEMRTRNLSWGCRRPVHRADNLTTFMCRLSWNLGASTFWNPQGLSRPVMGLLYLLYYNIMGHHRICGPL